MGNFCNLTMGEVYDMRPKRCRGETFYAIIIERIAANRANYLTDIAANAAVLGMFQDAETPQVPQS